MDKSIDLAAALGLRVFPGAETHLHKRNRDGWKGGKLCREEETLPQSLRRAEIARVEEEPARSIWTQLHTDQVGICRSQETGSYCRALSVDVDFLLTGRRRSTLMEPSQLLL